jgi:hypothetical protein
MVFGFDGLTFGGVESLGIFSIESHADFQQTRIILSTEMFQNILGSFIERIDFGSGSGSGFGSGSGSGFGSGKLCKNPISSEKTIIRGLES